MKRFQLSLLALFVLPFGVSAQDGPGAEALHALVGEWSYDQIEGGVSCGMLGENTVHCRGSWKNDAGNDVFAVFSTLHQPSTGQFRGVRYYGNGYMDSGRTWIDGDTWVTLYVSESGLVRKFTGTIEGDTWSYRWEGFNSGGEWEETSRGSMTRR